jgi:iron uptake system component EfeO
MTRTSVAAVSLLLALAAAACSSSSKGGGVNVNVVATDTTCQTASSPLAPGRTTFVVANKGRQTTELYVLQANKTVGEVENVGPGTARQLTVTLKAGTYDLACKPGGKGDGIRTPVVVAGGAGGTPAP